MSVLSTFMKGHIKSFRVRAYDVDVTVKSVTSTPDSGDAYGKTTSKVTSSTTFKGNVAFGSRYGYRSIEGGLVESGDLTVTTSLDNKSTVTADKTWIEIESQKFNIVTVEVYPDTNEMVLKCNRVG